MTDMRRVTIPIPKELESAIYELRGREEFQRCSVAEIFRRLVVDGLRLVDEPRSDREAS